ncbi:MAG: hypothetical protein EZS28_039457 [Streblomastix strix]|uniref:Uncharacterized protein n=1 Tax=Streblomastix strix TaxID=222440 RepID=A0A5J4U2M4_9EUKA|nr:MAG: hypothetical protein EZS28_039457 [Streblomastix strix]
MIPEFNARPFKTFNADYYVHQSGSLSNGIRWRIIILFFLASFISYPLNINPKHIDEMFWQQSPLFSSSQTSIRLQMPPAYATVSKWGWIEDDGQKCFEDGGTIQDIASFQQTYQQFHQKKK